LPDQKVIRHALLNNGAMLAATILGVVAAGAADVKAGQKSYEVECKDCHQMNGTAVASVAKAMQKKGVTMRDLKAKEVQSQTDEALKKAITEGSGKMQAVKTLSAPDADNVVAFVRTLKK
jgi:mono/diheme cytochrome c family protein